MQLFVRHLQHQGVMERKCQLSAHTLNWVSATPPSYPAHYVELLHHFHAMSWKRQGTDLHFTRYSCELLVCIC